MGLISKITNKIESKILHRDGSHSYPAELPPKDDSPHVDPSAPSPGEGIHAEDFAHRNPIRRSESAQRSDHDHELPVPDSSETRVGGQQRYYAKRRGESSDERQQPFSEEVDPIQRQPDHDSLPDSDQRDINVHGASDVVEDRNGVVRAEGEADGLPKVIDERKGLEKLGVVGI